KQKTALVAAFMHSPEIILLDEPTTGLDPLMRDAFIRLIKEEKKRGATIIMSNHMFDELEETCDYVAFIKDGHLMDIVEMNLIRNHPVKEYELVLKDEKSFDKVRSLQYVNVLKEDHDKHSLYISIKKSDTKAFLNALSKINVKLLKEVLYNLERFFMDNIIGGISNE
ncbi:MAG: AAA family ATPase, partial [Bacilli bacterium]|nr:AAA family ATPase [Bacilli bacterium]